MLRSSYDEDVEMQDAEDDSDEEDEVIDELGVFRSLCLPAYF